MTNEDYIKAIDMRCSRRTFRAGPLDGDTMPVLKDLVDYVNKQAGLNFMLIED